MDLYIDRHIVPAPSTPSSGKVLFELPPSVAVKLLLLNEMIKARTSNAEQARRLHTRPQQVQRIVNLKHPTKIDALNEALRALGKRFEMRLA